MKSRPWRHMVLWVLLLGCGGASTADPPLSEGAGTRTNEGRDGGGTEEQFEGQEVLANPDCHPSDSECLAGHQQDEGSASKPGAGSENGEGTEGSGKGQGTSGLESGIAACQDDFDNDGDGYVDCDDFDCSKSAGTSASCAGDGGENQEGGKFQEGSQGEEGNEGTEGGAEGDKGPENTTSRCDDGYDNDGDGYVDCDDFDCSKNSSLAVCGGKPVAPGPENTDEACGDGGDNDSDGYVDCEDFDCSRNANVSVCGGSIVPPGDENTDAACSDEGDNDGDKFIDCDDFDCSKNPSITVCGAAVGQENSDSACGDSLDNDGDGYVDCDDFDCSKNAAIAACSSGSEESDAACSDGKDNDGDNYADCDDYNCSRSAAVKVCATNQENSDANCGDGLDNDGDGYIDCADYDCSQTQSISVCGAQGGASVIITKVIDGDTAVLADGTHIRYIGINAPEMHFDEGGVPDFWASEATDRNRELSEGKVVYLEYDNEKTDKYGRSLVYVWQTASFTNPEKNMANAILVKEGYASEFHIFPNVRYRKLFENLEASAQSQGIGLWQPH